MWPTRGNTRVRPGLISAAPDRQRRSGPGEADYPPPTAAGTWSTSLITDGRLFSVDGVGQMGWRSHLSTS
jgi:hypothetical protein